MGMEIVGEAGRHPAGADPVKRNAILEGARLVFMEKGFDAAGVNDICRAAGISKSTLYVYFDDKEDLFQSMVESERQRLFHGAAALLAQDGTTAERLRRYGCRVVGIVCSDSVIRAQRIVIGIVERMPELGANFFQRGAMRAQTELATFLAREVDAGRLTIHDTGLAAAQFLELCTANLWKPRLFGQMSAPPPIRDIEARVDGAVQMFVAAYGIREEPSSNV